MKRFNQSGKYAGLPLQSFLRLFVLFVKIVLRSRDRHRCHRPSFSSFRFKSNESCRCAIQRERTFARRLHSTDREIEKQKQRHHSSQCSNAAWRWTSRSEVIKSHWFSLSVWSSSRYSTLLSTIESLSLLLKIGQIPASRSLINRLVFSIEQRMEQLNQLVQLSSALAMRSSQRRDPNDDDFLSFRSALSSYEHLFTQTS